MNLFHSITNADFAVDISLTGFLLILCSTLVCGLVFSCIYVYNRRKDLITKGFAMALVIVPMATAVVITMVGRNIATGLGLSGIFVLVRFRSGPIEPKDLSYLFASICSGVLIGCITQGTNLFAGLSACWYGYVSETGIEEIDSLLKGGRK